MTHSVVMKILTNFQTTTGMFSNSLITKFYALILLGISLLGTKGTKNEKISWQGAIQMLIIGLILLFGSSMMLYIKMPMIVKTAAYTAGTFGGFILILTGGNWMTRVMKNTFMEDVFNEENESFMQETRLLQTENSVNIPTKFIYQKKWHKGWINVVNPFRATMVLGTPGSGKSFAIVNNFIKQQIEKGFAMYLYDFKYPDLSIIAYNHMRMHKDKYKEKPNFYTINFDDPRTSNRCNPLHPKFLKEISDAYESAYTIMMNLNKSWIQKQGDFFVESPIVLLAAMIWYLKIVPKDPENEEDSRGKLCTFPHVIELLMQPYEKLFPILMSYDDLANYLSPFMDAWKGGAQNQLQGQIASAKIPLTRMISPELYWVMTGDDFTLDINNPEEPKILCIGNNPDKQNIYSTALSLYNSRVVATINKPNKLKCGVIIDELPTIFFRGLDNLIATGRGRRIAVTLGFQDFTQLIRDYGDKEAKAILGTIANVFSGQVVAETAKTLSERYGKILQKRTSVNISRNDKSTNMSTQMDSLIPASKISALSQGWFVGNVQDDFGLEIKQKTFHCQIVVDVEKVKREEKQYYQLPLIYPNPETYEKTPMYKEAIQKLTENTYKEMNKKPSEDLPEGYHEQIRKKVLLEAKAFSDDELKSIIINNYKEVKQDIKKLVEREYEEKKNNPEYSHLFEND